MTKHFKKMKTNGGAAMLILVIFFLFISLAIIAGLVSPAVREFRNAAVNVSSKQSFFLAESGTEDALYRILNNINISDSEVLTLNSNSTTTSITSVGTNEKDVVSLGDVSNFERKNTLILRVGDGAVFRYGSQSGEGGLDAGNNAGLLGSFYSNGNIEGKNGAYVTGDAYAANSPALAADQLNDTPVPPPYDITFGTANATQDVAQSFQLATNGFANKAQFYIKKTGTPANVTVRITTDSSGSPSTTTMATGTLNASLVSTNYGWIDVAFTSNPYLASGTTYWLVIDNVTSTSNYYILGGNPGGYASGQAKLGAYSGSWGATSPAGLDGYFQIYLGGITNRIYNMIVGTNGFGDVRAHTVIDTTIAGSLYCQEGSGNNKACNTGRPDPTPIGFPISEANITDWKTDAENGGVINGNYTVSTPTTLGPKKIIGNLIINAKLTVANTVWVTGNISMQNNVTIKLDPSYGEHSGLIIADGFIDVPNGVNFQDSGTAGSYIMLLSTSACDAGTVGNPCAGDVDSITIRNNSNIIIANAQRGAIFFANNATVKEVAAYKIKIANNAIITYGSGIFGVGFTSGPPGGWDIFSWKETQ